MATSYKDELYGVQDGDTCESLTKRQNEAHDARIQSRSQQTGDVLGEVSACPNPIAYQKEKVVSSSQGSHYEPVRSVSQDSGSPKQIVVR
jgi:hypothetical protein